MLSGTDPANGAAGCDVPALAIALQRSRDRTEVVRQTPVRTSRDLAAAGRRASACVGAGQPRAAVVADRLAARGLRLCPGGATGKEIGGPRGNTAWPGRRIPDVNAQPDRFGCDRGARRDAGLRGGARREPADTGPAQLLDASRVVAVGQRPGRAGFGSAAASSQRWVFLVISLPANPGCGAGTQQKRGGQPITNPAGGSRPVASGI